MRAMDAGVPGTRIGAANRWTSFAVALLSAPLIALPGAAVAREALGVFEGWGAFSDPRPRRCFAIAEPDRRGGGNGGWRPFAAVATWPGRGYRAQLNIRLRHAKLPGAPVLLTIGPLRQALVAGGADAWAPNARIDARIVAAIRQGTQMTVTTRARNGRAMTDSYSLRGAATAIDAAALACARG